MNVTNENFHQLLPQIKKDISSAAFISFDCEFSGLGILKETQPDLLDTPETRYNKVSRVCTEFLPLQVGICIFEFNEKDHFYIAKPYNFNIFPRTGNRFFGLDRCYSTQISSLEFLLSNNFDLNQWAKKGIPFVNHDDYERIMEKLDSDNESSLPPQKGESLYEYSQESIALAKDFLQNSTERTMQIATPSTFHKRIVHISIAKEFNGFIGTFSKHSHVELVKYTEEERVDAAANSRAITLKAELEELVGFRRVVDALVDAKVSLVGHNLLHDLCFLYDNFYRQLPLDFHEFKYQVHENFPLVIDTKLIAQTSSEIQSSLKNTVLSDMARVFQSEPFLEPKIVFGREFEYYNTGDESYHEAGYDAYITGLSLLRMYTEIVKPKKGVMINLASEVCQPNKVFMMRSLMTFMNLNGEDDKPDTSNVFLLSKFPATWKAGDVQHALKELGHINLKWLDDQSCLVIVRDPKKVTAALEISNRTYKKSSAFMLKAFIDTSSSLSATQDVEPTKKRQRVEPSEKVSTIQTNKIDLQTAKKKEKKGCLMM